MKRVVLLTIALAACTPAPTKTPREATSVTPAPVTAPPIAIDGDRAAPSGVDPFAVVMDEHAICVRLEGEVHCGTGERPLAGEPVLGGVTDAIDVSTRSGVVCLVTRHGAVHCKGSNANGELGAGLRAEESKELVRVSGIDDATRVAVGEGHVCVLRTNGTIACWGRNESGQTGSSTAYRGEARELVVPTTVTSLKDVTSVATGDGSTCATTQRGATFCFGESMTEAQQQANGNHNEAPFRIEMLAGAQDLTTGAYGYCAITSANTLCWAARWDNSGRAANQAALKIAVKNARRVRAGRSHACALTHDGAVYCWGSNMEGELGRPKEPNSDSSWELLGPGLVEKLPHAFDIAVGGSMACAIVGRAEAMCWGGWPYAEGGRKKELAPIKLAIH